MCSRGVQNAMDRLEQGVANLQVQQSVGLKADTVESQLLPICSDVSINQMPARGPDS